VAAAQNVWAMFGPVQTGSSVSRPFGSAVVNGFDFDLESTVQNMEPFAAELRSLMNAAEGTFYLSAAPQCPYPDQSDESFIDGEVDFDWVQVQFYNNFCGVDNFQNPNAWDFSTWNTWATTVSLNPNAKVLMGIAANTGAANAGSYVDGTLLAEAIASSKSYPSFGGVMMWDMSQLYANTGFEAEVVSDMAAPASGGSSPTSTTSSSTPPPTTLSTVTTTASPTSTSTSGTVPQWGQCGGEGYTGPTQCASPYTCVENSVWWSQCE
jgi:chitinase